MNFWLLFGLSNISEPTYKAGCSKLWQSANDYSGSLKDPVSELTCWLLKLEECDIVVVFRKAVLSRIEVNETVPEVPKQLLYYMGQLNETIHKETDQPSTPKPDRTNIDNQSILVEAQFHDHAYNDLDDSGQTINSNVEYTTAKIPMLNYLASYGKKQIFWNKFQTDKICDYQSAWR